MPAWASLEDLLRAIADTAPPFDSPVTAASRRSDGDTPLHVAAVWGDVSAIEMLIQAGADLDATGDMGCTALHNAVGQGHVEAARTLLVAGASPYVRSEFGTTAEEYAIQTGTLEMVALFRKT